jgi:hypothetical protein
METPWKLQKAKTKFSQPVEDALKSGPGSGYRPTASFQIAAII